MASSKLGRLLSIVLLLRSKEWVSAQEIADRFGVSLRTVYRDIETLQEHGTPVRGVPGPEGGYRLDTESPLPQLLFGSEEALGLYLLGAAGAELPTPLRKAADRALAGIGAQDQTEAKELLNRAASRIHFDTTEWFWRDEGTALLPQVREAVFQQRVISFEYAEKHEQQVSPVRLEPYGLVWKGGQWYIVGRTERGRVSRYRLARVRNVRDTSEGFEFPDSFNLEAWWTEELERYGTGPIEVRLRVEPGAQEEFRQLTLKRTSRTEEDGADLLITLFVDRWDWLVPILLSYAGAVIVEDPQDLRERVMTELATALERYRGASGREPQKWNKRDDSRARATRGRSTA
jgi:predicted DNA-binding transcriptional regulator YafY